MDDAALIRAAADGDARAFTIFMRAHQAAVHRYLLALMGSDADAEDALQDTFINAWRGAGGFQATGSAQAWLYAIARNAARHQGRRRVGEPQQIESLEALAERAGWGATAAVETDTDAVLARDVLDSAMRHLPAEDCEVLTLRELDGFSGEETARLLEISLPAMKSRLHRARIHLAAAVRALDAAQPRSSANA